MKIIKNTISILAMFIFCYSVVSAKNTEIEKIKTKPKNFEVGVYLSSDKYREEEGSFMEQSAFMKGLFINWQYHNNKFYFLTESIFGFGSAEYSNPLGQSADDINQILFESRALLGYDIITRSKLILIAYTGFGYRRLSVDGTGIEVAPSTFYYDRISNYYYLPLGIKLQNNLNGWDIETNFEYDFLIQGRQESYLSDVAYWFPDVKNTQKNGYGLKAKLSFVKKNENIDLVITPFINYWKVSESEHITTIIYPPASPPLILEAWEPRNDTFEWGIRISIRA